MVECCKKSIQCGLCCQWCAHTATEAIPRNAVMQSASDERLTKIAAKLRVVWCIGCHQGSVGGNKVSIFIYYQCVWISDKVFITQISFFLLRLCTFHAYHHHHTWLCLHITLTVWQPWDFWYNFRVKNNLCENFSWC